jgi:hypothetical protein
MAFICKVIEPGAKVVKTIYHVYNWEGLIHNCEMISLEFDNGNGIMYNCEMKLDLPNGDFEKINGEFIKCGE